MLKELTDVVVIYRRLMQKRVKIYMIKWDDELNFESLKKMNRDTHKLINN